MNKYQKFQSLHLRQAPLLLPNTWDLLSAKILEQADFPAIATTSYGVANAHGRQDGEHITFDQLLASARGMVEAVEVPVSVDVEAGFARTPKAIAENILKIAEIGAVGINIEDSPKEERGLRPIGQHKKVIEKIRHTLDTKGYQDFYINARIDTYFQGKGVAETYCVPKHL